MPVTRCYRDGILTDEGFPVADLSEHLEEPGTQVWADLGTPDRDDLRVIAAERGLHDLAAEDAIDPRERPKP
jgi:magnesium transporter